MKVLICGSRIWTNRKSIRGAMEQLPWNSIIVHGGAQGVDSIAGQLAKEMGFEVRCYPANWKKYGHAAGPIRNQEMLDKEKPKRVIAFQKNSSRGTQDMIDRAMKAGIFVKVIVAND